MASPANNPPPAPAPSFHTHVRLDDIHQTAEIIGGNVEKINRLWMIISDIDKSPEDRRDAELKLQYLRNELEYFREGVGNKDELDNATKFAYFKVLQYEKLLHGIFDRIKLVQDMIREKEALPPGKASLIAKAGLDKKIQNVRNQISYYKRKIAALDVDYDLLQFTIDVFVRSVHEFFN